MCVRVLCVCCLFLTCACDLVQLQATATQMVSRVKDEVNISELKSTLSEHGQVGGCMGEWNKWEECVNEYSFEGVVYVCELISPLFRFLTCTGDYDMTIANHSYTYKPVG